MRLLKVDESWVWTRDHAEWLKENTLCPKARVVGTLVFTSRVSPGELDLRLDVALFDVTPVTREWIDPHFSPSFYYYYDAACMKSFVQDCVDVCRELGAGRVGLKHKRSHRPIHDRAYVEWIAGMEDAGLVLIPPKANLAALCAKTPVSICIPFTSPANIAQLAGKSGVFYDPTGLLARPARLPEGLHFASGSLELRQVLAPLLMPLGAQGDLER